MTNKNLEIIISIIWLIIAVIVFISVMQSIATHDSSCIGICIRGIK